jgi:hypothetical protein
MKDEATIANIFRPFRAGCRVDVFLGLKPQTESICPFGARCLASNRKPFTSVTLRLSSGRSLSSLLFNHSVFVTFGSLLCEMDWLSMLYPMTKRPLKHS